jgi:hypothetical protein
MTPDPDIAASFRATADGYVSCNGGGFISCPPYVIANVASRPDGTLELPEGYGPSVLDQIKALTGFVGRTVFISFRQGDELAQIGAQLLALEADGKIELRFSERQSIVHLIEVVNR